MITIKIFSKKERFLLISDIISDNIYISFNGETYFCRIVLRQMFRDYFDKPYKIRNITMKNSVENASENSRNHSVKNSVKILMLKWASQGGGGQYVVKRKN
jgi:hypothetical protein